MSPARIAAKMSDSGSGNIRGSTGFHGGSLSSARGSEATPIQTRVVELARQLVHVFLRELELGDQQFANPGVWPCLELEPDDGFVPPLLQLLGHLLAQVAVRLR